MSYDANGNLISRVKPGESFNAGYAGFDKPRWMAKTTGSATVGSEFLYNANRSRVMQLEFDAISGSTPTHYTRKRIYAMGPTLEVNYANKAASGAPDWALKKVRIYVPGPDGIIGAREFDPAATGGHQETALVYHYDHLGSIESITPFGATSLANDATGKSGRFSEDAWGQRRNPGTWSGAPTSTDDGGSDSLTPRGFTGHEMLDDLGLVHMNGRIYDPLLGRMLSADIVVQNPANLQDFNRYSYVKNNPLTLTDPTGFIYDNVPLKDDVVAQYLGQKLGEGIVDSFNTGKAHAEAGAQEFSNASNSSTPGLDRTIAGLHMVAMVGAATDTVAAFTPEGKGEKVAIEAVEKVATKAESVVAKAVSKSEGAIATAERKVEGIATRLESKVSEKAATTEVKAAEGAAKPGEKVPEGVVYKRTNPETGDGYVGQAKSPERFEARQGEHDAAQGVQHDYEVLGRAEPGKPLDVLEETKIRENGGIKKEGGKLENSATK